MGSKAKYPGKGLPLHSVRWEGRDSENFDAIRLPSRERFWSSVVATDVNSANVSSFSPFSTGADGLGGGGPANALSPAGTQCGRSRLSRLRGGQKPFSVPGPRLIRRARQLVPLDRIVPLTPGRCTESAGEPVSDNTTRSGPAASLEFVHLFRRLKAELRPPTADECALLLDYSDWAGLPVLFGFPDPVAKTPQHANSAGSSGVNVPRPHSGSMRRQSVIRTILRALFAGAFGMLGSPFNASPRSSRRGP